MRLVLVHHADAVGPEVDPQRPLSMVGRFDVERLAAAAAAKGVKPAVIWHSGKLRSRQTAEAFWKACNPFAEFKAMRGLQPSDIWLAILIGHATRCGLSVLRFRQQKWRGIHVDIEAAHT